MSALKAESERHDMDVDRVLIAGLGRIKYSETKYVFDGPKRIEKETKYAFDAIGEIEHPNKIMLVGTVDSKWEDLIDYYNEHTEKEIDSGKLKSIKELLQQQRSKKKEIETAPIAEAVTTEQCIADYDSRDKEGAVTQIDMQSAACYQEIENIIKQAGGFTQVKLVIIPAGISRSQQDEYFDILRAGMETLISKSKNKRTEVIFDITYAFRSIPIYVMMLVRYYDFLKSHNFEFRAYYGAFEAKDENNLTPLIDLSIVPIMTDWINAIHEFIEFGSVKTLIMCLINEKKDKSEENAGYIDEVINEFSFYEYAANANNLYHLIQGVVYLTGMQHLSTEYEKYKTLNINHPAFSPQAKMMLAAIRENYIARFSTEAMADKSWGITESYFLAQIAKLFVSQGNYGDAAIAFQEGVLTYTMERFLKKSIMEANHYTSDSEFYGYVHDFAKRDEVKQIYINEIENSKGARSHSLCVKTEFHSYYILIKNRIRNTQAHFKYAKVLDGSVKNMEEWLNKGIDLLLEEMESGYGAEETFKNKTGLREIYQVIEEAAPENEAKKDFFKKIFVRTYRDRYVITGISKKIFKSREMENALRVLNLSEDRVRQWVKELADFKKDPSKYSDLIKATYCKWVENELQSASTEDVSLNLEDYMNRLRSDTKLQENVLMALRKTSETSL